MRLPKRTLKDYFPRHYDVPALIIVACGTLVFALTLPLMTVEKKLFWKHWENTYSVYTGVIALADAGDYFLAAVLFFFSMVFPFIKLTSLLAIWFVRLSERERARWLQWLGILGKWSMLDVFVVAIIIVAARMRSLAIVEARVGAYVFCAAIILSMLATMRVETLAKSTRRL